MNKPPRYIPVTKGEHHFVRELEGQWRVIYGLTTASKVAKVRKLNDTTTALLLPEGFETREQAQVKADWMNSPGED